MKTLTNNSLIEISKSIEFQAIKKFKKVNLYLNQIEFHLVIDKDCAEVSTVSLNIIFNPVLRLRVFPYFGKKLKFLPISRVMTKL